MSKFNLSLKTAVLLMAFGGPDSASSIKPFVLNVLGGREISH